LKKVGYKGYSEGLMTEEQLKTIMGMLPFLIPLFLIQVALMVIALVDLFKRENMKTNTGWCGCLLSS